MQDANNSNNLYRPFIQVCYNNDNSYNIKIQYIVYSNSSGYNFNDNINNKNIIIYYI